MRLSCFTGKQPVIRNEMGKGMSFPKKFVWGAASAAYQIEGASDEDGKGPSVWDMFCRKKGAVWNGQSGAVACDHSHRYRPPVRLLRGIVSAGSRVPTVWLRVP